jgi:hypothetical protein
MKVSSPPAYYDIFNIYNAGGTLSNYVVPSHRGLFITSTSTIANNAVVAENLDGTTCGIPAIANTAVVLPLVIKKISIATALTGTRIYGLL